MNLIHMYDEESPAEYKECTRFEHQGLPYMLELTERDSVLVSVQILDEEMAERAINASALVPIFIDNKEWCDGQCAIMLIPHNPYERKHAQHIIYAKEQAIALADQLLGLV